MTSRRTDLGSRPATTDTSEEEIRRLRRQVAHLELQRDRLMWTRAVPAAGAALARPLGSTGRSILVLGGVALVGLVSLSLAWQGVAHTADIARELPYVISGGFAGVTMIGTCLALASIQARRRCEAMDRESFSRLLSTAAALLEVARAKRVSPD